jgi:Ca-activated chloride channel family protein
LEVQVSGPKSNVTLGAPAVSGGSLANAASSVARLRAGIRACHQRALQENPEVSGTARALINVGPSGQVTSVNVIPSGNLSASLTACVTARLRAAQFEAPQGTPTVALPIRFTIEAGGSPQPPGAVVVRPRVEDVAVIRAGDETWQSQGQAALDKLQKDLAATPDSRKKNEALIRGLLLRGRFAPALAAAEHFVELDPDLPVARELLSYAAVATGDRQRAVAAIDAMAETAPGDLKVQGRAARAFEALGDEARACAHWRSMFELAPTSDATRYESLRCRARVLGDSAGALRDGKAVGKPGPLLQRLLPLLESGQVPAFEKSSGSVGQLEAGLSCEPARDCPYVIVITPTGSVFSPWTPALGRSSPTSFAFSGLMTGMYRVLLIGGSPNARGKVDIRALSSRHVFEFAPGHPATVSNTQVTLRQLRGGPGVLGFF